MKATKSQKILDICFIFICKNAKYLMCLKINRKSFPVGEIDETQYYICYNIMYMLYKIDVDKLSHYCDELMG